MKLGAEEASIVGWRPLRWYQWHKSRVRLAWPLWLINDGDTFLPALQPPASPSSGRQPGRVLLRTCFRSPSAGFALYPHRAQSRDEREALRRPSGDTDLLLVPQGPHLLPDPTLRGHTQWGHTRSLKTAVPSSSLFAVLSREVPPPTQRCLCPQTCECVASRDQRDFADVVELRIWSRGDDPRVVKEARGRRKWGARVGVERVWADPRSRRRRGTHCPVEPHEQRLLGPHLGCALEGLVTDP